MLDLMKFAIPLCVCCVTKFICKHEFIKCEALEGFIIDKYINVALI